MFRRLCWVTEFIESDGRSTLGGVYTSIPDLMRRGLPNGAHGQLRLTLIKLDAHQEPLGVWVGPGFDGFEKDCEPFVATDEVTTEQVVHLIESLRRSVAA